LLKAELSSGPPRPSDNPRDSRLAASIATDLGLARDKVTVDTEHPTDLPDPPKLLPKLLPRLVDYKAFTVKLAVVGTTAGLVTVQLKVTMELSPKAPMTTPSRLSVANRGRHPLELGAIGQCSHHLPVDFGENMLAAIDINKIMLGNFSAKNSRSGQLATAVQLTTPRSAKFLEGEGLEKVFVAKQFSISQMHLSLENSMLATQPQPFVQNKLTVCQSVCLETEVGFSLLSHFVLDGSHSAIASNDCRLFLSQPQDEQPDGSLTATSGSCGFVAQKAWEPHTGHTNVPVDSLTGVLSCVKTWSDCGDSEGTLVVSTPETPEVPPEPPPFKLFGSFLFPSSCVSFFLKF
jgi:hypothetical protein